MLQTKIQVRRQARNLKILAEYKKLITKKGASAMVVYELLSDKYEVSQSTIIKLINKSFPLVCGR
jgi:hypothetical protein